MKIDYPVSTGFIIRHTMKKLLILIVAIALFLHFYPQPEVDKKFAEIKATALEKFSSATDTKVRLKADKIYTDLKDKLSSFSAEEQEYLKELTSSREQVKAFYLDHCKGKKHTVNFHSVNLKSVCQTIDKYQNLL